MKLQILKTVADYASNLYQVYIIRLEDGTIAIMKLFLYDFSDENNEHKIIPYFQSSEVYEGVRNMFPTLLHCITRGDEEIIELINENNEVISSFSINDEVITVDGCTFEEAVYQILIYSFEFDILKGVYVKYAPCDQIDVEKFRNDITRHLTILHNRGLVYGNSLFFDVMFVDGEYILTDYSRTFSIGHKPFPPMRYMVEYGHTHDLPTVDEDFKNLDLFIERWINKN